MFDNNIFTQEKITVDFVNLFLQKIQFIINAIREETNNNPSFLSKEVIYSNPNFQEHLKEIRNLFIGQMLIWLDLNDISSLNELLFPAKIKNICLLKNTDPLTKTIIEHEFQILENELRLTEKEHFFNKLLHITSYIQFVFKGSLSNIFYAMLESNNIHYPNIETFVTNQLFFHKHKLSLFNFKDNSLSKEILHRTLLFEIYKESLFHLKESQENENFNQTSLIQTIVKLFFDNIPLHDPAETIDQMTQLKHYLNTHDIEKTSYNEFFEAVENYISYKKEPIFTFSDLMNDNNLSSEDEEDEESEEDEDHSLNENAAEQPVAIQNRGPDIKNYFTSLFYRHSSTTDMETWEKSIIEELKTVTQPLNSSSEIIKFKNYFITLIDHIFNETYKTLKYSDNKKYLKIFFRNLAIEIALFNSNESFEETKNQQKILCTPYPQNSLNQFENELYTQKENPNNIAELINPILHKLESFIVSHIYSTDSSLSVAFKIYALDLLKKTYETTFPIPGDIKLNKNMINPINNFVLTFASKVSRFNKNDNPITSEKPSVSYVIK